jgi:hypothetical protein
MLQKQHQELRRRRMAVEPVVKTNNRQSASAATDDHTKIEIMF